MGEDGRPRQTQAHLQRVRQGGECCLDVSGGGSGSRAIGKVDKLAGQAGSRLHQRLRQLAAVGNSHKIGPVCDERADVWQHCLQTVMGSAMPHQAQQATGSSDCRSQTARLAAADAGAAGVVDDSAHAAQVAQQHVTLALMHWKACVATRSSPAASSTNRLHRYSAAFRFTWALQSSRREMEGRASKQRDGGINTAAKRRQAAGCRRQAESGKLQGAAALLPFWHSAADVLWARCLTLPQAASAPSLLALPPAAPHR